MSEATEAPEILKETVQEVHEQQELAAAASAEPEGETTRELETSKPKKARSPAQVAAFAKARERLAEKRAEKLAEKAAVPPPKRGRPAAKKKQPKKQPQYVLQSSSEESESESEEEVVFVKRAKQKAKPKQKKQPKVVYVSSSSEEEEEPVSHATQRFMRLHSRCPRCTRLSRDRPSSVRQRQLPG